MVSRTHEENCGVNAGSRPASGPRTAAVAGPSPAGSEIGAGAAFRIAYGARALRGFFSLNLPVSARVRRDFRLDLVGALLYGVFNGSVVGYIYVVARTIGVSQFGISVLASMGAIGCVLSMPASLLFTGRASRPFLMSAFVVGRGALLPIVFLSGPTPYMVAISMFFVIGSMTGPFYAEVMQHVYPREYRGQLMSLVRVGGGIVMTLSSLLTAWLLGSRYVGYQAVFGVGGVLSLLSLIAFFKMTPVYPPPRPRQSMRSTIGILVRDRAFARYELWVSLMASGAIMAATLYPLVIVDKLHAGYGPFGVLAVVTSVGYLSSWFVWGRIIDRRGPIFTMLVVGLCESFYPLSMLFAPATFWLAPAVFGLGVASAGFEIGPVAAVIHYARRTPGDVPLYMGLHSILIGVRGTVFPFVAIAVLDHRHYSLALAAATAVTLIGTVMLWRVHEGERRLGAD